MRSLHRAALVLMVLATPGCSAQAADWSPKAAFARAVAEAKAALATPAGHRYDIALSAHFEAHNGPVLMDCFDSISHPETSPFEMVFVLSREGTPRQILVWPETNIATCFKHRLETTTFPVPPQDGYLAYMEMRLAP